MATIRPRKERKPVIRTPDLHHSLCLLAEKFLKAERFGVVVRDGFNAVTSNWERPDAIGFRQGTSCLIEVKISRADFKADRTKPFRAEPQRGICAWRFYLCPPGIIAVDELPAGWGLLHADNGKIQKIHGWPPNTRWRDAPFRDSMNVGAEADIMYSALRRLALLGHFDHVYSGLHGRCSLCDRMLPRTYIDDPIHGRICPDICRP